MRAPSLPSRLKGVVLVCVDTLRADATEPDASGHSRLPSLDAFARGAVHFTDAIAPSSWTGPSVGSLLTGLVPPRHGLVKPDDGARISAGVGTLATMLQARGWSTWASVGGGWVSEAAGAEAGFDSFEEKFDERPPAEAIARWRAWRPDGRPFLLFIHTYAAHDPYGDKALPRTGRCSKEAAGEYEAGLALAARMKSTNRAGVDALRHEFATAWLTSPCRRQALADALTPETCYWLWDGCLSWLDRGWRDDPAGPATAARMREAYFAGLSSADRVIAETLAAVSANTPQDGVLTIVTADHGEAFGDHGALYHGRNLTEDLVRVPLLVSGPGFTAGDVVDATCGLVDVVPTILDAAGAPPLAELDGQSLLPLVHGSAGERATASFVRPPPIGDEGHLRRASVRSRQAAWVGEFDTTRSEWTRIAWFDRTRDPGERAPGAAPATGLGSAEFAKAVEAAKVGVERTR